MRKKIGVVWIAMIILLSACGRIPGIDSLDRSSQVSEETDREQAEDRQDESGSAEAKEEETSLKKGGRADGDSRVDGDSSAAESKADSGGQGDREGVSEEAGQAGDEETDSYMMGVITDDGWESEYWNLCFTAPEGVYMLSEEGLNTVMGLSEELLSERYTERQQEYVKLTTLYEMMSMNVNGDANAAVTVEKLPIKGMDAEGYRKAALFQLRLMQDPVYEILEDSGTAEIGGETYETVKVRTEGDDQPYLLDYYFRVEGERALILLISYTEDTADIAEEILNGFSALSL